LRKFCRESNSEHQAWSRKEHCSVIRFLCPKRQR